MKADVMVEIQCECARCGADLESSGGKGYGVVCVKPCQGCLESERSDGRDEGYEQAIDSGED